MDNADFEAQKLTARCPEEICRLLQKYMAKGDIDLVLSLYDKDVVFLNQSSEPKRGQEALRKELTPFASAKASFDFNIRQVIQAGDIDISLVTVLHSIYAGIWARVLLQGSSALS